MWLKANPVDLKELRRIPSNQYKYVQSMNIAYKDIPGEKVLFCIPPWPSSSAVYMPLALALGDNTRVIALDLPGWGGYSDKPRFKPTVTNYAKLINDFILSFELPEYDILGYSFG
jgi:pimeloyl-ACP methyl ester carboxylesterase